MVTTMPEIPIAGLSNPLRSDMSSKVLVSSLRTTRLNHEVSNPMLYGIDASEQIESCLSTTNESYVDLHIEQHAANSKRKRSKP